MIFLYFLGIIASVLAWWGIGWIIMLIATKIGDGKVTVGMIDSNWLGLTWAGPLLIPLGILAGIATYIEILGERWNEYIKNNTDKKIW